MTTHDPSAPSGAPSAAPSGEQDLLDALDTGGFERLVVCSDPGVGLRGIIAIHSTQLGPANGGVRMAPYPSFRAAADDAMRLARAMTYKWAAAGEDRGGGKSVIVGDPRHDKTEALLRRFGQFVDTLRGDYHVGQDMGMTLEDMEVIHRETDHVATLPVEAGGIGDIAPATARGALQAMRACAQHRWGSPDLRGRTVALQGLGACGSVALRLLVEAGAVVTVADTDPARVRRAVEDHGVRVAAPDEICRTEADIFAPFALGGVITDESVASLRAQVVAGSANNILREDRHGHELEDRGIVVAPDFVANAGGAIYDADQFRKGGFNAARADRNVDRIFERTLEILDLAETEGIPAHRAALALAQRRLRDLGGPSWSRGDDGGRAGPRATPRPWRR